MEHGILYLVQSIDLSCEFYLVCQTSIEWEFLHLKPVVHSFILVLADEFTWIGSFFVVLSQLCDDTNLAHYLVLIYLDIFNLHNERLDSRGSEKFRFIRAILL